MRIFAPGFLLGVWTFFYINYLPQLTQLGVLLTLWVIVYYCYRKLLNLLLLAYLAGLFWACFYASYMIIPRLTISHLENPVKVLGVVTDLPIATKKYTQFILQTNSISKTKQNLKLTWYYPKHKIVPGQHWQLITKLRLPRNLANPAGFNFKRYALEKNIAATGYVIASSKVNKLLAQSWLYAPLTCLRYYFFQTISAALKNNSMIGFILALSIGYRGELTPMNWQVLQRTGTSHLVAISGLHIGLVAGLSYFIIRRLFFFFPKIFLLMPLQQIAALLSLVAATLYSAMAGFAVPTQRALIMLMVFYGSVFLRRNLVAWHAYSVALLFVLFIDPCAVLSISFWLSFAAVAMIIYTTAGRLSSKQRWLEFISMQWWIILGLLPFSIWFFYKSSLVAPLANLVAIPWITFLVVPEILLACILHAVNHHMASLLYQFAAYSFHGLWYWLSYLAEFHYAAINLAISNYLTLLLISLAMLLLLSPRGFPAKYLSGFLVLPLFFIKPTPLANREFKFTLLNVGQGLAAVIQTKHHVLLYDTGKQGLATLVISPYLFKQGIFSIDKLVISHWDNDHAGGMDSLLEQLKIKKILVGQSAFINHQLEQRCHSGQTWQWDGVHFKVLWPTATHYKKNNTSCVLKVSTGNYSLLLPGDIEKPIEYKLVKFSQQNLWASVLVAPHHGSNTSSTWPFILSVKPAYVLFSVGFNNRFHLPAQQVIARYQQLGTHYLTTANSGAITFYFSPTSLSVPHQYRMQQNYWWLRLE